MRAPHVIVCNLFVCLCVCQVKRSSILFQFGGVDDVMRFSFQVAWHSNIFPQSCNHECDEAVLPPGEMLARMAYIHTYDIYFVFKFDIIENNFEDVYCVSSGRIITLHQVLICQI